MTYIALARKWRPRTFSELLGQDHLVRALTQSLAQDRVHHAYLFTGTRGVGKTSVGRILAKALNCLQGVSAHPCLQCEHCQAIEQGRFIDLIEIDGASKTKVEDTRELLDNVQYAPTLGRYKIYLIDEVHMLSQHSFNALLKTLEEPPAHVKFFLATTDVQKLPITILSRCLQFHLKQVPESIIQTHLQTILQSEQISFEPQALSILAKAAKGSMRDALSLLDQCLAGRTGALNALDVANLLGQTTEDYAIQMLQALCANTPQNLIDLGHRIEEMGGQFRYVLNELLAYLHRIAVVQALSSVPEYIESQTEIIDFAQQISPEDTQLWYQIGLNGLNDLPYAPSQRIGFEMILLRMYTFKPVTSATLPKLTFQQAPLTQEIHNTLTKDTAELSFETIITTVTKPEPISTDVANTVIPEILEPVSDLPAETSMVENQIAPDWATLITQLPLTGLALTAIQHSELVEKSAGQVILKVGKSHQSIFTKAVISRIQDALAAYYQETLQVQLQYEANLTDTPAAQKKVADDKQQEAYLCALQEDPIFQQLQKEFTADLLKDSVTTAG